MKKKLPMRTCVISKEVLPKKELIRITATKEGEVSVDLKGKAPGRGAYLKLDIEIIKKAKTSKALEIKLQAKVPKEVYEQLMELAQNAK